MVRDVFRLARENSPSVIFIDEIDAIATKRFDAQTGADREVQRILLELLNQMDGFDQSTNVKVCVCVFLCGTVPGTAYGMVCGLMRGIACGMGRGSDKCSGTWNSARNDAESNRMESNGSGEWRGTTR